MVTNTITIFTVLTLINLLQPVCIPFRGFRKASLFVHTEPDTSVMTDPIVEIVFRFRCPCSPVIGRIYRCTVRFHLPYRTCEIHAVQIHGVSCHIQAMHVQVGEIARLHSDVRGRYLPGILVTEHTTVGASFIYRRLSVGVGKVSVAGKMHILLRMQCCPRTQRIAERTIILSGHSGYTKICRSKTCKTEIPLTIIRIFGGIQCPVIKMDDTHTYVVRRNSAYFSGFQFKVYGTGGEKFSFTVSVNFHTLNNAHTRRAPFNAGIHFHTIKPEFGHFQPFPKP